MQRLAATEQCVAKLYFLIKTQCMKDGVFIHKGYPTILYPPPITEDRKHESDFGIEPSLPLHHENATFKRMKHIVYYRMHHIDTQQLRIDVTIQGFD